MSRIAILSTEALLHNVSIIRRQAPSSTLWAMVKANAYGHGLRSVSLRLEAHVDQLAVACIEEAYALRSVGITKPIVLIQGVSEPHQLARASHENFHVVFHDPMQLEWLRTSPPLAPLTAWLKINTGLGRLGFSSDHAERAYETLHMSPAVHQPIGIMSHFACADVKNHPLNYQQIDRFTTFIRDRPGPKSFCNSAGIFCFPDQHYDVVRAGIALYGISPLANCAADTLGLKPVMTLQTRLIAVRHALQGSTIGYGARYMCPENMPIGVIALGYGDGLARTTRDGAPVMVNGVRCEFAGKVSMDMATIDLRNCPTARVGDLVTVWGEGLPAEEMATYTNLSPYDMLTGVQNRVKFHWTTL